MPSHIVLAATFQFRTYKIIYRKYASLYFLFCVDMSDNELAYYEGIHLFVELLDSYFGNVCELDLVFNFHKVSAHSLYGFPFGCSSLADLFNS